MKVRALFYVLQQIMKNRLRLFDTALSIVPDPSVGIADLLSYHDFVAFPVDYEDVDAFHSIERSGGIADVHHLHSVKAVYRGFGEFSADCQTAVEDAEGILVRLHGIDTCQTFVNQYSAELDVAV